VYEPDAPRAGHHQFAGRGLTYREAFERAATTWPQAHADHVARVPRWLTDRADVMLEAGAKERALFALRGAPQDTYARPR
jgi:UV DNA damage endonuclease